MSKDIVKLKLERRLLEEKLKEVDGKCERYSSGLLQRTLSKGDALDFEQSIRTRDGIPVAEFKQPYRTSHKLPLPGRESRIPARPECNPSPVEDQNILRIRQEQMLRSVGRSIVDGKIKEKQVREEIIAKRQQKKPLPTSKVPPSMLPNRYIRGELPCTIEHGINGHYLSWVCPLENLDYEYYLPIFFDGLQCREHPVSFLARQGVEDLLYASRGSPNRVLPVIKFLCRPIRNAFAKFDREVMLGTLKALQQLVQSNPEVGPVLLSFGKVFLGPMLIFIEDNRNIGDSIDYGQRRNDDVGEEVRKTLELLEENGGPDALKMIKFSIPLYQSCVKPPDAHHKRDAK